MTRAHFATFPFLALLAAGLAACSVTRPAVAISSDGHVMRGSATGALSGGSFSVTGYGVTCAGHYDSMSFDTMLTMQVLCSDGRKGVVTIIRDSSLMNGSGTFRLEDGLSGTVMFGDAAAAF